MKKKRKSIAASRDTLRCDESGGKITLHTEDAEFAARYLSFRKGEEKVNPRVSLVVRKLNVRLHCDTSEPKFLLVNEGSFVADWYTHIQAMLHSRMSS